MIPAAPALVVFAQWRETPPDPSPIVRASAWSVGAHNFAPVFCPVRPLLKIVKAYSNECAFTPIGSLEPKSRQP